MREYPVIIERGGEFFIARHDLNSEQEVLVWLTRNPAASGSLLQVKVSDSNKSRVRSKIKKMIDEKLIGLSADGDHFIMPRGQAAVIRDSLLQYKP